MANSEDPDEMQHSATFHQGLHRWLSLKQPAGTEIHHNLEKYTSDPFSVHNGQSHTHHINMYGKPSRIRELKYNDLGRFINIHIKRPQVGIMLIVFISANSTDHDKVLCLVIPPWGLHYLSYNCDLVNN